MYLIQRFFMESLTSYVFFSTFTYDDEHLPTLVVNDYTLRYANFKHFTDMVKRIRLNNLFTRPFRYYAVSERGFQRARPHFHCLWFLPKFDDDSLAIPYNLESVLYDTLFKEWRVNLSSDSFRPIYEPLFTYHKKILNGITYTNFDTHFVKPTLGSCNETSVVFYCMKYLLKRSVHDDKLQKALKINLSESEYREVWNTVKSRCQCSKHFGYGYNPLDSSKPSQQVLDYIHHCIKITPKGSSYPCFFSPIDGSSYPLSPYYQGNCLFYTFYDALDIALNSENSVYSELPAEYYQKYQVRFRDFQKQCLMSLKNGNPLLFD